MPDDVETIEFTVRMKGLVARRHREELARIAGSPVREANFRAARIGDNDDLVMIFPITLDDTNGSSARMRILHSLLDDPEVVGEVGSDGVVGAVIRKIMFRPRRGLLGRIYDRLKGR